MVICLGQGADLHIAQLMPLTLTISCSCKSKLVLPEWFCFSGVGLPRVSWKKRLLNECSIDMIVFVLADLCHIFFLFHVRLSYIY